MARKSTSRKAKETKRASNATGTAVYIRVSTDRQVNEGYSLDAQHNKLLAYCAGLGWAVDPKHIYRDEGVSAKTTARPQYQAMLSAVEAGDVRRIVAIDLSRLSRNTRDFLTLLDYCDEHACGIVSIAESFDTSTAVGRAVVTILMVFNELERKQIAIKTQGGRDEKAKQGKRNGAPVPYGYARDDAGAWSVVEDHAQTVRFIFERFIAGDGLRAICRRLNDAGIPPPRGEAWYPQAIGYLLDNGWYAGLVQYGGRDAVPTNEVQAIITRGVYDAAGKRLAVMKQGAVAPMVVTDCNAAGTGLGERVGEC
jgi:site-specific DNA recombinase